MDHATVLLPEFLLALLFLVLLATERLAPRLSAPLATFGLVGVLGVLVGQALGGTSGGSAFAEAVQIGNFAVVLRGAILLAAAAAAALAWGEAPRRPGLFFGLLTASTLGAMGLAGAADLRLLVLSQALMGMPLLGMLALSHKPVRCGSASREAAMKLFVFQGVATSVLLFGITWLFGLGGSTSFTALGAALQTPGTLLSFSLLLILGGLAFMTAAIPFQAWLPDAAEGGSAALGAWMLGGVALAAAAGLVRVLMMAFATNSGLWAPPVTGLALLGLLVAPLLALAQSDLRRMLAFFAITSTSLLLAALGAASHAGASNEALVALVMTALTSAIATTGLFAGLGAVQAHSLSDLHGLHRRHPRLALALTLCSLGLAALPLTGAFWARLALVRATLVYVSQSLQFGAIALAVLIMLVSVVAAYAALRIPKALYLPPLSPPPTGSPTNTPSLEITLPAGHQAVLALCTLLSLAFFAAPGTLWALASLAGRSF